MPYKKKNNYKKSYKRKEKSYNIMGPLKTQLRTRFVYHDDFLLNPPVGGLPSSYIFSMNGIYDPNITSTGHQPRGFDQLAALYDHFVVIGCKATIWATNSDTTNAALATAVILDSTTSSTLRSDYLENRFVKVKSLAPEGGGPNSAVFSIKVNPNKFLGRSKPLVDPDLKNSAASNPIEQCFLHIGAMATDSAVDMGAVQFTVRLEYDCIALEPKQPSQS